MSTLTGSICLLLVSVFISSVSQILLKKAADRTYENHIREYLNPLVIFSYGMRICACKRLFQGWNLEGYRNTFR